ncbi:hypothetical protein [Halomarina rubra]|uniref:DUF5786 domain-containing protein n=1 Tax=Halomarina rubra TaxID=2071873 RepID=A0ABD6ATJ6_9EURY|nr:hypothetical protein [Halomarina rubra]
MGDERPEFGINFGKDGYDGDGFEYDDDEVLEQIREHDPHLLEEVTDEEATETGDEAPR